MGAKNHKSLVFFIGFLSLSSVAFAHEGERNDNKGYEPNREMLFEEGSGSSAISEYEHSKTRHQLDQQEKAKSLPQDDLPISTSPEDKSKSSYKIFNHNGLKKSFEPRPRKERFKK